MSSCSSCIRDNDGRATTRASGSRSAWPFSLRRITTGNLADEFGRSLEEISDADPLLNGTDDHD